MVQGLPLPLLKICDFGYSKAHFMSAPKSKVRRDGITHAAVVVAATARYCTLSGHNVIIIIIIVVATSPLLPAAVY
jgi:hypothetical protein